MLCFNEANKNIHKGNCNDSGKKATMNIVLVEKNICLPCPNFL